MNTPMPALIGHRGLPLLAPENTRASLECAAEHGIPWVEIDVTMAGDDSLVIMHDLTLKRFGQPNIQLIDIDETVLRQVDAGSWFNEANAGEPLLFLHELLPIVHRLNLNMNLEIKINPGLDVEHQVAEVLAVVKQFHVPNDALVISSFDLSALGFVKKLAPDIAVAILYEDVPENWQDDVKALTPVSVHCDQSVLREKDARAIQKIVPLYCYTVNDTVTFEKLLDWGVAGVFCDRAHADDMREIAQQFYRDLS